jgi:DNA-binding NtrC family response regulator
VRGELRRDPGELMESELFGHKRGSFTGAVADKKGLVQSAEGGTLFLDEVADLPLHMQVKLLRLIQEKTVRPVGEHRRAARRRAASSRQRTRTWRNWWRWGASARTSTTAST